MANKNIIIQNIQRNLVLSNNSQLIQSNASSSERLFTPLNHTIPLPLELYKPPYNSFRRAKIMLFGSSLSQYDEYKQLSNQEKITLLKQIERACYNTTIDLAHNENIIPSWDIEEFCNVYHSICYKISVNLDSAGLVNNPSFAKALLNGQISISMLPKLTSREMFPQKYTKILQRMEASKNASHTIKISRMYKCRKCKESRCVIENLYNRALDEGVNLHITCVNCGYEFNA